jgi:hypothetical protein
MESGWLLSCFICTWYTWHGRSNSHIVHLMDLFRGVWVCLGPVSCDLFSSSEPNIIERGEMFNHPLECRESTRSTYPPGVQGDRDVGGFPLETFLADSATSSAWDIVHSGGKTHSNALMQCWAKASSEPYWPSQNLKSFCDQSSDSIQKPNRWCTHTV